MYTLRSLTKEGHQNNIALGNHYSYISRDGAKEIFNRIYKDAYRSADQIPMSEEPNVDCIGMIQCELIDFIFLWKQEENYIMTDSGKTFAKL